MFKKMITKMAKEALKKARDSYKDKAKKIRAGKGTTQEKLDKIEKAGMAYERQAKIIKKQDIARLKKKPAVKVSPGGKGKDAPAKPIGQMGLRQLEKKLFDAKNETEYAKMLSRIKKLEKEKFNKMSKQKKFDKAEEEFEKRRLLSKVDPRRMGRQKGGITMPMHGKKKSKMMARGGMKKKSKMMARGGMKKSKMMARGGMKKTKSYARGGAARRK